MHWRQKTIQGPMQSGATEAYRSHFALANSAVASRPSGPFLLR
jgi:hypothetical protein